MRLGMERFNQKLKMSPSEGIKTFFEQFIQDSFSRYNSHAWREERFWNEDCDITIKDNLETLQEIYA